MNRASYRSGYSRLGCFLLGSAVGLWPAQAQIFYGNACDPFATEIASESYTMDVATGATILVGFDLGVGDADTDHASDAHNTNSALSCTVNMADWGALPAIQSTLNFQYAAPSGTGSGTGNASVGLAAERQISTGCNQIAVAVRAISQSGVSGDGHASPDRVNIGSNAGSNFEYSTSIHFCLLGKGTLQLNGELGSIFNNLFSSCSAGGSAEVRGTIRLATGGGTILETPFDWNLECPFAVTSRLWNNTIDFCPGNYWLTVGLSVDTSLSSGCIAESPNGICNYSPPGQLINGLISASVFVGECYGDIDNDGSVTIGDLSLLLAAYGTSAGDPGYNAAADLDHDGDVDLSDFSLLLSNFGGECPVC